MTAREIERLEAQVAHLLAVIDAQATQITQLRACVAPSATKPNGSSTCSHERNGTASDAT